MDWDKALKCEHKNTYENYAVPGCPICGGYEYHCKDCGVYFTDCRCGDNAGMSGWSGKRWRTYYKKKGKIMMKIGDKLITDVNKESVIYKKNGIIKSIGKDLIQVDFGNGNTYGIIPRRIVNNVIKEGN